MPDFHLNLLNPYILEQVIKKLEGKSYCRLQQTCRRVGQIIRNSRNISIFVEDSDGFEFDHTFEGDGKCSFVFNKKKVDVESLYGVKLFSFQFFSREEDTLDQLLVYLQEYRITCLNVFLARTLFTTDRWLKMLNALKPVEILSYSNQLAETIIQCKTLKIVSTPLKTEDAIDVLTNLFSRVKSGSISTSAEFEPYNLIHKALKIFISKPLPSNLKEFYFHQFGTGFTLPSEKELMNQFKGFNLIMEYPSEKEDKITAFVTLPQTFPQGSYCKLTVFRGIVVHRVDIHFATGL